MLSYFLGKPINKEKAKQDAIDKKAANEAKATQKAANILYANNLTAKKLEKNAAYKALFNKLSNAAVLEANDKYKLRAKNIERLKKNVDKSELTLSQQLRNLRYGIRKQANVDAAYKEYENIYNRLGQYGDPNFVPEAEPVVNKANPFDKPFKNEMAQRDLIYRATQNPTNVTLTPEHQAIINAENNDLENWVDEPPDPVPKSRPSFEGRKPSKKPIPRRSRKSRLSPYASPALSLNVARNNATQAAIPATNEGTRFDPNIFEGIVRNYKNSERKPRRTEKVQLPKPRLKKKPTPSKHNSVPKYNKYVNKPFHNLKISEGRKSNNQRRSVKVKLPKSWGAPTLLTQTANPVSINVARNNSSQNKLSARKTRKSEFGESPKPRVTGSRLEKTRLRLFENSIPSRTQRLQNNLLARKERKFSRSPNNVASNNSSNKLSANESKSEFGESPKPKLTPEQIDLAEKLKDARDALRGVKAGPEYLKKEEALLIAYINFKLSIKK